MLCRSKTVPTIQMSLFFAVVDSIFDLVPSIIPSLATLGPTLSLRDLGAVERVPPTQLVQPAFFGGR